MGNLYYTGGRPELAAAAFEHSLSLDPAQVESHFSVAKFPMAIGEWNLAAYHNRRMLLHASRYDRQPAEKLRDLLASGLQDLFIMHTESDQAIPFLPEKEEIDQIKALDTLTVTDDEDRVLHLLNLDLYPEEMESFYPLAELYMGKHHRSHLASRTSFDSRKKQESRGQLKKKRTKRRK